MDTAERVIALSFDDGPDPSYTDDILNSLEENNARATFFLIGQHAQSYESLVQKEVRAGMEVGNHTWSHPRLNELSPEETVSQVQRTAELLTSYGTPASLFRAPYGEIPPDSLQAIDALGLRSIHWSLAVDKYLVDGETSPPEAALAVASQARPGDIILAHDARDGGIERASTVAMLRLLLPKLKARGLKVVTVSELLQLGSPIRAQPRLWFWQSGFTCPSD